jgi:hypothetical protein
MAEDIYGTSVAHLKGKTAARKGGGRVAFDISTLPHVIADKYKLVTLCGDIFYINGVRFLATISRHIQFCMAEHIKDAKIETLEASLKAIQAIYWSRGLKVDVLHMDDQFEPIRYKAAAIGMHLNVTSNEEHVPKIERSNRTVKERVRSVYATLPFKKLPVRFIIKMVAGCILWLNAFPVQGGVANNEPASHRNRGRAGLQRALPDAVWRVRPDARTTRQLDGTQDRRRDRTVSDCELTGWVLLPEPENRLEAQSSPLYAPPHARRGDRPRAQDGTSITRGPHLRRS